MPYGKSITKTTRTYRRTKVPYRSKVTRRSRYTRKGYKRAAKNWAIWKNPLPHIGYYKLTYNDTNFDMSTSTVSGYVNINVFRGNSCYDPDQSGVGVQPYGYDNFCGGVGTPFQRYKVFASKITIYPHVTDRSVSVRDLKWAVFPFMSNTATYIDFEDIRQIPYSRCITQRNDDDNNTKKISNFASTKKMWAVKDIDDVTFAAPYNANPTNEWFWHVRVFNLSTTSTQVIKMDVKIVYYVQFTTTDDINES